MASVKPMEKPYNRRLFCVLCNKFSGHHRAAVHNFKNIMKSGGLMMADPPDLDSARARAHVWHHCMLQLCGS